MNRHILTAAMLLGGLAAPVSAQVSLNFEVPSSPCSWVDRTPLTTQYASQGVTFNGSGAVLDQCSGFGLNARSGRDFLTYISSAYPVDQISFSAPQSYFDVFAASPFTEYRFYLGGVFQDVAYSAGQYQWSEVTFNGVFDRVDLNDSSYLLLDDLTTRAAVVTPEPASLALLATGLIGIGGLARGRRRS